MRRYIRSTACMIMAAFMVVSNVPTVYAQEKATESGVTEIASGSCGESTTWLYDSEGTLTISGTGAMEESAWEDYDDDIDSEIKKVVVEDGVTKIHEDAFGYYDELISVELADSVEEIEVDAFRYCEKLETVKFSKNLKTIGTYAFQNCYKLKSVELYDKVTTIEDEAFADCHELKSIVIPDKVTEISDGLYANCYNLKTVTLPSKLKKIGMDAFSGCEKLESITLPDSLTEISSGAFEGCSSLSEINVPSKLDDIGSYAFAGTALKDTSILKNVRYMGAAIFLGCDQLTKVSFPKNIDKIKGRSFASCTNLTSVTVPTSVTAIEYRAFEGCTNLKTVLVPESVISIQDSAFVNCDNLIMYLHQGTEAQKFADDKSINYKVMADKITVTPAKSRIYSGESTTVSVKLSPAATTDKYVVYSSSNKNVATVSDKGEVKAVGLGTATITVKNRAGKKGTCTITVGTKEQPKVTLGSTKFTYNGKAKVPTVTVKDSSGKTLKKNTDYTVTYSNSSSKDVGTYYVTVTFKGIYSGSKKLSYTIYPAAPSTASAKLTGHKSVKVTWSKVTGATAYKVLYKKASDSKYTEWGTTTNTYKSGTFAAGTTYTFKVIPRYGKDKKVGINSKTVSITTLKQVSTPKVTKGTSGKVKVSWTNIAGESGYQISYSTNKSNNGKILTYNGSSISSKEITVNKNTTYYYKVRAYKIVDGVKICSPWSNVVAYKLK